MNVNRLSEPGRGLTELGKYNDRLVEAGVMLAGDGLAARSEGKRVRFGGKQRTVVDGPSAETEELVAGFWIWQVRSMDALSATAMRWLALPVSAGGSSRSWRARTR